jgi:peptidoglycan/LPS O-acetylase OafA/YrhL
MDKRFYSLDAMRGIAALTVVISHIGTVMPPSILHYSYLGVDFFFMLSGFVLTRAYASKLKSSMSGWRFMEARLIRLYPMFALGGLLGLLQIAGQLAAHSPNAPNGVDAIAGIATNALILPDFRSAYMLFPVNAPGWTLFFELVVNALFAAALFRMRSAWLIVFCACAGALSLWSLVQNGNGDTGWSWPTIGFGVIRVGFAFPLGILLARIFGSSAKRQTLFSLLPIAGLAILFVIDLPTGFDWIYNAAAIFIVLPAILWFGATLALPKSLEKFGAILGDASYPLFAVHFPLMRIIFHVFVRRLDWPGTIVAVVFVAGSFLFSWFLFHYLDVPVRRWLSARSQPRPTAVPATS